MKTRSLSCLFLLAAIPACANEPPSQSNLNDTQSGFARLIDAGAEAGHRALLPSVMDSDLRDVLESNNTIWYDKSGIYPAYQDSFGSPKGMRPNTIRSNLIDGAVPGGHASLFRGKGRFHFPFGTGGIDDSTNTTNVNFWSVPRKAGKAMPVVYWVTNWDRWQWMFPVGTVLGEVLFVNFPDGSRRVFEIRTRTRTVSGWSSDAFRPFRTAKELAATIKAKRPSWSQNSSLVSLVTHLEDNDSLVGRTLESTHYVGAFPRVDGYVDVLPDFGDQELVKQLLSETSFKSVKGSEWKRSGSKVAFAPDTSASFGITGNRYDGGVFEVSDKSCARCHQDAGRSFQDFHPQVAAYGEIWGEDQVFSWHLFENSRFVRPDGDVKCFNADPGAGCSVDDNRVVSKSLKDAGLVVPYDAGIHTQSDYSRLSQSWTYKPF